jgi:hypothetical protein
MIYRRALRLRALEAVQQMATYWSILEKMRGSKLRLTKFDDDILEHLKRDFPEIDVSKRLNEDEMKSKKGKERWRNFMMTYEKTVEDYNFGTMLRASPECEYTEKDTIFCKFTRRTGGPVGVLTRNKPCACSSTPSRSRGRRTRDTIPWLGTDGYQKQSWPERLDLRARES